MEGGPALDRGRAPGGVLGQPRLVGLQRFVIPGVGQTCRGILQRSLGYGSGGGFWTTAPSNPIPYSLFDTSNTYDRPGAAYIALRQILGPARFDAALRQLQRSYGGASISEAQLEAVFGRWLPVRSRACQQRLSQFFTQWFDTAYPSGGGANRPMITGPGLAGPGFYSAPGVCG